MTLHVLFSGKQVTSLCKTNQLPSCTLGLLPRPQYGTTGFYYKDHWNSLVCKNSECNKKTATTCLQNQRLHFWGDSTLRQWYEYFAATMKDTLVEKKSKSVKFGPHVAIDKVANISFYYRHHGYPIRNSWTNTSGIYYVPNMIDKLDGNANETVLLSLWAHFTATNTEFYRSRWLAIREAILRLKKRNQGARFIIKSANTREKTSIDYLSWFSWRLDLIMKEIMSGVDGVTIIDVWDMTIGHRTGFRIHPTSAVISQEIGMLLSFLCNDWMSRKLVTTSFCFPNFDCIK